MLDGLKKRPESTRRKIAFSLSLFISLLIFSGWALNKGYFGYSTTTVAQNSEGVLESSSSSTEAPKVGSPLVNSESTFNSAFDQIKEQFNILKESLASVLVPFITGIDVYNKGDYK